MLFELPWERMWSSITTDLDWGKTKDSPRPTKVFGQLMSKNIF